MKHLIKILILFLFFMLNSFANDLSSIFTKDELNFIKNNPIIEVGVAKNIPSFDFYENNKYKNFTKDYFNEITKISGFKFEFYFNTRKNILDKFNNKELDLLAIISLEKSKNDENRFPILANDENLVLKSIIQKSLNNITLKKRASIYKKWLSDISKKQIHSALNLTPYEKNYLLKKKKIIVANEYDWIPFDFNEDEVPKGYFIDYIKLLSEKMGIEIEFVTNKWAVLIKKFKNKQIDIFPVVSYNKKREEFLTYTKAFISQELSIITKESENSIINMDDLKSKKIAMIKDWNLTKVLKEQYPSLNVIEFDSIEDIFEAIKNNFVDATIQNKLLAKYYINKNFNGYLKTSPKIHLKSYDDRLFIGLQKDDYVLYEIIQKAISSITKEEETALKNKWLEYGKELLFTKDEKEFIENTTINIISTNNWAPFNFIENKLLQGISIDFWNYVANKAKLSIKSKDTDIFNTALNEIKNKKADVLLASAQTKDRKEYAIFSNSYSILPIGIATLQDKNYIKDSKELLNKKIAVGLNYSSHKLLFEKHPNMQFEFVSNAQEGLELLSQNKVYAYVDIMPVLSYNIKKLGFTNIKIAGDTNIDYKLKFMIRNDYSILKSIIDKTLATMSYEDKELIFNKWLKVEVEEKFDYSLFWKIIIIFFLVLLFVLYKNRQLTIYQKKLEKIQNELQNSLDNIKSLIDFNIAGILIVQNEKVVYCNDEAVNMLNYKRKADLNNKKIKKLIQIKKLDESFKNLDESINHHAYKSDGTLLPIVLKTKEIMFFNKKSFILSIVDLTEVKKKEEIISQQAKMASLGEMIGNIAHQWRQPLSTISTTASGVKLQKEFNQLTDEKLKEHMESIVITTKFLSQTIDDFRNYIKKDKRKKEFNISENINKILTIMKGSFTNNFITIETNIEENSIYGYENELNQVLLNILSNSKDALKNVPEEHRYINIESYKKDNSIIIIIMDSGGGIDEDILEKIIEPYFTTKHQSQGTGLGLYMTHKIITESMNGKITIKNCKMKHFDKCAKVEIELPIK